MSLVKWDNARQAIIEAKSVDELAEIVNMAEAYRYALKQAKEAPEVVNAATEIKIRAERRAGEFLKNMHKNTGQLKRGPQLPQSTGTTTATLAEMGITKDQSSKWQRLASIPEEQFEENIETIKDRVELLSTKKVLSGGLFSSVKSEWYTPKKIIEGVVRLFGQIDLDPCSNDKENPTVPALNHFTKEDDGLSHEWIGKVYMNPPYGSDIPDWVEKVYWEYTKGTTTEAVCLVPARTDTAWFNSLECFPRLFIKGRLQFSGYHNSAPFPSALFYLGDRVEDFVRIFSDLGVTYTRYEQLSAS
jgi:phage N-6-adenine-methyltransferase